NKYVILMYLKKNKPFRHGRDYKTSLDFSRIPSSDPDLMIMETTKKYTLSNKKEYSNRSSAQFMHNMINVDNVCN
ncbi:hypothetical protein, partial [Vibrio cholerae]|uniref:hypothetical protein n=1 Tax=Vibrio cholerae TaxID=666 RepID=UPI00301CBDE8